MFDLIVFCLKKSKLQNIEKLCFSFVNQKNLDYKQNNYLPQNNQKLYAIKKIRCKTELFLR